QVLRSESLVDLDETQVVQLQSSSFDGDASRRNGTASHQPRLNAGNAPTYNPAKRIQSAFLRVIQRHDHYGCAAVHDAARVSRGNAAVFAECRFQVRQPVEGGFRTPMIVFFEHLAGRLAL